LENLDKTIKISIQTKSDLILRDIDLFRQFKDIEVGLTINTFTGKAKNIFEPGAISSEQRIKALKILKKAGLKTFVFVSPLLPGLIDLKKAIEETKDYADYYFFEFINIRAAGAEFMEALRQHFPESHEILRDRRRFLEFVKESKKVISSENIKVHAIEIHGS